MNDVNDLAIEFRESRDSAIFGLIYQKLYRGLKQYVLPMVHYSETFAEDVTQDAFIKAYTYIDNYDPDFSFTTWLWRIAQNTAFCLHRTRMQEQTRCGRYMTYHNARVPDYYSRRYWEHEDPLVVAEEERMELDLVARIREKIDELPEPYREIMKDREYRGLSYEQIADTRDMKINTVRTRLARGRSRVKEAVERSTDMEIMI